MTQVFDNGWDEKIVNKDISGPSSDGCVEIGGRVYYHEPLSAAQDKALDDHINKVIQMGKRLR